MAIERSLATVRTYRGRPGEVLSALRTVMLRPGAWLAMQRTVFFKLPLLFTFANATMNEEMMRVVGGKS